MSPEFAITLGKQALTVAIMLAAPVLIAALIAGVVVGMFQAATQINEQTMSFVPKLAVLALTLFVAAPWMLHVLLDFTRQLFMNVPNYIH